MSKGALAQGRFEAIEAFLLGTLPAAEHLRFEQELNTDAELRAEVELQRENMLAVEMGGMERTLRGIMAQEERRSSYGWGHYLKYAAAVAVLLIGALWWFSRPPLNERLYAEYHQTDPGLPVPMSATRNPEFQDAMVAYKLGNYAEATAKWSNLLKASTGNDTLNYYIASAQLAEGNATAAIPLFKIVASDAASVFHEKARWHLFLSYLHDGRYKEMRAMGIEEDSVYGTRARRILEQVNK
jgi:hypothetical protein